MDVDEAGAAGQTGDVTHLGHGACRRTVGGIEHQPAVNDADIAEQRRRAGAVVHQPAGQQQIHHRD